MDERNRQPDEREDDHARSSNGKQNFARYMIGGLCLILFLALTGVGYVQVEERRGGGLRPFVSGENKKCIDCHMAKDVAVGGINDWKVSRHAPKGIGCVECHRAEKGEADAYDHEGFLISTLVTPKDCMRCHDREAKEFAKSHHAKAAQFTGLIGQFSGQRRRRSGDCDHRVRRLPRQRGEGDGEGQAPSGHLAQLRHRAGESRRLERHLLRLSCTA